MTTTADAETARVFYVEAFVCGKRTHCGRLVTTETEIRAAFPDCHIRRFADDASLVTVTKRPPTTT